MSMIEIGNGQFTILMYMKDIEQHLIDAINSIDVSKIAFTTNSNISENAVVGYEALKILTEDMGNHVLDHTIIAVYINVNDKLCSIMDADYIKISLDEKVLYFPIPDKKEILCAIGNKTDELQNYTQKNGSITKLCSDKNILLYADVILQEKIEEHDLPAEDIDTIVFDIIDEAINTIVEEVNINLKIITKISSVRNNCFHVNASVIGSGDVILDATFSKKQFLPIYKEVIMRFEERIKEYQELMKNPEDGEEPYKIKWKAEKVYNPQYGDNRICICGHRYASHFDSYEEMEAVGCKYCGCNNFVEA